MKLWRGDNYIYIPFFRYKFYYKQAFVRWSKTHWPSYYRKYILDKRRRRRKLISSMGLRVRGIPAKKRRLFAKVKKCYVCGQPFKRIEETTLEHIRPKNKIKSPFYNRYSNLSLSHYVCNQKKADK